MKKIIHCHYCKKDTVIKTYTRFTDCCPHCGMDLHCCKNCDNYDENAANQCTEERADIISDKEKFNSCPYFTIKTLSKSNPEETTSSAEALKQAEALFKKAS